MKVTSTTAAVAAYVFCCQDLASAGPLRKRGALDQMFEITTLGGMTFKINQVQNKKYYGQKKGRGSMAIARAYSKFGASVSDDLLATIEEILRELGLLGDTGAGAGNNTTNDPQGMSMPPRTFVLKLINS